MTKLEIRKMFALLTAALPTPATSDGTLGVWETMLSRMPAEVAARTTRHIIETRKFFPTVAEILEVSRELPSAAAKRKGCVKCRDRGRSGELVPQPGGGRMCTTCHRFVMGLVNSR